MRRALVRLLSGLIAIIAGIAGASVGGLPASAQVVEPTRTVHFLVDVSGSMSSFNRIGAARDAVSNLVTDLNAPGFWAGLRTFGVAGCDTALNVPPGPVDQEIFLGEVAALRANGFTPLAAGLAAAAADLDDVGGGPKAIVLVADGENNCGGDPCQVAQEIAASGTALVVHAAGIQVAGGARAALECIAEATGGRYIDVVDPTDLQDQLTEVVSQPRRTVVLGDSFSSGEGSYQYNLNQLCHRGTSSWAGWLETKYPARIDIVSNYACSGAKIGNVTDDSFKDQSAQLDDLRADVAAGLQVDLVMFTIGGNDAGFGTVVGDCFAKNGPVDCASGRVKSISRTADAILRRVQNVVLPQIQAIVGSDTPIVWVGYPRLFPVDQEDVDCWWLADNERRAVNNASATFNVRGFYFDQDTDAYFLDSYDVFDGRELCTERSLLNPVLGKIVYADEQAHPITTGYEEWAVHIHDSLREHGIL